MAGREGIVDLDGSLRCGICSKEFWRPGLFVEVRSACGRTVVTVCLFWVARRCGRELVPPRT